MEKIKKIVLYISGPGVLFFELVALFIHLFTPVNTRPWLIGGLVVFFVVFLPLYSVEYFRQEFKKNDKKAISFGKNKGRTEWRGGNIHGKVPTKTEGPGKLFKQ
ncbi:hypothetical protein SLH46_08200 [Draconibacterium sp. IB214405]|uniref:hypothetical protein n=1 Tax=Draconibacterium sp. IB214405 TaxID=3097352 RepID=UPI002A14C5CA|nr:hypothetical protein [Draconibacterium sp. IB214405]MDX8339156.1 hypothetical protein [Draconibacterium sp. IB214405]